MTLGNEVKGSEGVRNETIAIVIYDKLHMKFAEHTELAIKSRTMCRSCGMPRHPGLNVPRTTIGIPMHVGDVVSSVVIRSLQRC